MILYNNIEYPVRQIYVKDPITSKNTYQVQISTEALQEAVTDGNGSIEEMAEWMDSQIWYYCDKEEWSMDDDKLTEYLNNIL